MGNGPLIWSICHLKMPLKFVTTKSLRTDKKTNLTKVQLNVICEMSLNVLSNSSYIRFHWEPGGACCVCKPIRSPCTSPHCSFPPNCHQRRDEQLIPDGTKCVIVTMCGTAFNLLEKSSINFRLLFLLLVICLLWRWRCQHLHQQHLCSCPASLKH